MRRAARVDANQPAIVAAFRAAGATVQHLHAVGEGVPDLLVAWPGLNVLVEVKDGSRPPSERRLTPAQERWHAAWPGPVHVVATVAEVRALCDTLAGRAPQTDPRHVSR